MPFHFGLRNAGALGGAYGLAPFEPIVATGGDEVDDVTIDGVLYRFHAFTSTGSSSFIVTDGGAGAGRFADVLVVGSGAGSSRNGANANNSHGGGGAGGLVFRPELTLPVDTYTIVVGARATFSTDDFVSPAAMAGDDSSAFGLVADAGAGGGNRDFLNGGNGGSGGGAGSDNEGNTGSGGSATQPQKAGDSGTFGFGNNGANTSGSINGGGGGGAGGAASGTAGGVGLDLSATFSTSFGVNGVFAAGGSANVSSLSSPPQNTGNGADAGVDDANGVLGSSGIVIVRYPLERAA